MVQSALPVRPLRALLRRFRASTLGLAATEFAMTFPIILALGLTGMEMTHRIIVTMQVNQIAVQLAVGSPGTELEFAL